MLKRTLVSLGIAVLAQGCSSKNSGGRQGGAGANLSIPAEGTGSLVVAHVTGNDVSPLLITATTEGPIKGTSVALPVGAFLTDVDLTIEQGLPLVSATTAADLGAADAGTFEADSVAIVVSATPDTAGIAVPFQLSIPLTAPNRDKLVVLARYPKPDPSTTYFLGLLAPGSAQQLGNVMTITAPSLGAYQIAHITGTVPPAALEVPSTVAVLAHGATPAAAVTPGAFAITSPLGAGDSSTPFAAWTASAGAASYEVSVGKTAKCADKLQDFPSITNVTAPLANLADGNYFVCVTATSASGATLAATNNSAAFTVAATAPGRFKIVGAPGHVSKTGTPTITWGAATGATSYILTVGTAAGCATPLQVYDAVAAPTQTLTNLPNGSYFLCLVAQNSATERRPADNTNYQLSINNLPPGAFTIFSPTFNTAQATLFLNWGTSANAVTYNVVIASDAACATVIQKYSGLGTTSKAVVGISSGSYDICVTSVDGAGNTTVATNNGASFILDVTGPPGSLTIVGPTRTVFTATPNVTWTAATGAVSYTVGIGTGVGCNSPRTQTYPGIVTTSLQLTALPDGTYDACISAIDSQGASTEATNDVYPFEIETSTVHIAYVTLNNGTYALKYAMYTGGAWAPDATPIESASGGNFLDARASLTLNNADVPQVGYALNSSGNFAAKYAHRTGANAWTAEVVENLSAGAGAYGRFNALALGTTNIINMEYVHDNATNAIVRLATGTTGAFVPATIDAAPATGTVGDAAIAMTHANQVEFLESVNNSGTWTVTYRNSSNYVTTATAITNASCTQMLLGSLQVDAAGATHIAYGCVTAGGSCQVYYIKRSGGVFGASELVGTITGLGCTATLLDNEAYRPRLAVDSASIPRIAWWDQSGANLKYATRASGSWVASTPVATGTVLGHVGIALDLFDKAYLFYTDNAGLHSLSNNADSVTPTWSTPLLVDANVVGISDPAITGVSFRSAR